MCISLLFLCSLIFTAVRKGEMLYFIYMALLNNLDGARSVST